MSIETDFSKGNAAVRSGDAALAIDFYHLAILSNPSVQMYRDNLRRAYKLLGKHDLADMVGEAVYINGATPDQSSKTDPVRKRITVAIPTFNRHEMIQRLVKKLDRESKNFDVTVLVFDDGSTKPVALKTQEINNLIATHTFHQPYNHGKQNYWRLANKIFDAMASVNAELNIYLADDLDLMDGFLSKTYHAWEKITDPKKVSLNLLNDGRTQCWTKFERVPVCFEETRFYKSQWLDMAMAFDKSLLRYRLHEVSKQRWVNNELASSGVGAQLSSRLHKSGYAMYQVIDSLATHGDHDSQMNFEERKKNPLRSFSQENCHHSSHADGEISLGSCTQSTTADDVNVRLPVVCGVATIPGREESLRETVVSILPQVDKLIVYQNGYKNVFHYLKNEKIEVISSLDTGIDMGDAGKFFGLKNADDSLYFSIDDDLIYPPDYVKSMTDELSRLHYEVILTCHGRIMKPNATSYYKDIASNYKCLGEVSKGVYVHFGGTGVMAFRTGVVKITHDYFRSPNMADVWMGLFSKKEKIPIKVLPHKSDWIQYSTKFNHEKTLFRSEQNKTFLQDLLLRECEVQNLPLSAEATGRLHIAFIACTYGRPEVSKRFKNALLTLQAKFESQFIFTNIIVDSENSNASVFANDEKFEYHNHQNLPLSNKWSYALASALKHEIDYVFVIGSDDVIDETLFKRYEDAFNRRYDFIGILDMYVYDVVLDAVYYWGGYPDGSTRHGETIGLGRAFSREFLRKMDDELWPQGLNKSLDGAMTKRIREYKRTGALANINQLTLTCKDIGYAIDIKAGQNITLTKNFVKTGAQELIGEEKYKIKLLCSE